jgi:hypothetical protein
MSVKPDISIEHPARLVENARPFHLNAACTLALSAGKHAAKSRPKKRAA